MMVVESFFFETMYRGIAEAYPPVPITTSGSNSFNILFVFNKDITIRNGKIMFLSILVTLKPLWNPLIGSKVCQTSFIGKTFDSRPNKDPI